MSDTKHTDEGWRYDEIGASHGCPRVIDKDGFPIADLRGWGHLTGTGSLNLPPEEAAKIQDARGRRIGAVNELLAACKMVAAMAVPQHPLSVGDIAEVFAAIAKAEGRFEGSLRPHCGCHGPCGRTDCCAECAGAGR